MLHRQRGGAVGAVGFVFEVGELVGAGGAEGAGTFVGGLADGAGPGEAEVEEALDDCAMWHGGECNRSHLSRITGVSPVLATVTFRGLRFGLQVQPTRPGRP